jgi:hypothetical protein
VILKYNPLYTISGKLRVSQCKVKLTFRGVPDPDALESERVKSKADMLERMAGGKEGKTVTSPDHRIKPMATGLVKTKESREIPGVDQGEEGEEEEEYIDEGDPVVVPWGASPASESADENIEEEEGVYSEDELIREPCKCLITVVLTHSTEIAYGFITTRNFHNIRFLQSRSISATCSSSLHDYPRARCDR